MDPGAKRGWLQQVCRAHVACRRGLPADDYRTIRQVVVNAFYTTRCIEGGKGSGFMWDLNGASQVLVDQNQAVMVHSTKDPSLCNSFETKEVKLRVAVISCAIAIINHCQVLSQSEASETKPFGEEKTPRVW